MNILLVLTTVLATSVPTMDDSAPWLTFNGAKGPGIGKHIVFITGDEEYRSEEGMPQMAQILNLEARFF